MSVYVGIDLHRKRSQVAVINQDGAVLANRNVPNGVKPILSVIGGLPSGTPAATWMSCATAPTSATGKPPWSSPGCWPTGGPG